jgi:hypothetical protein
MTITKKEAAERLAIIAAEIRLALDEGDEDCPSWADDLLTVADALHPSGFVDESGTGIDTRYSGESDELARQRDDLRARLHRIYAAATTDADLAGLAVRDFLMRESEVAVLPDVIIGLTPKAKR